MGQNQANESTYQQGGDLFTSLISGLFTSAIGMAVLLDHTGNDDTASEQAKAVQQHEQTEQQKAATLIRRQRESIDPVVARETAMMNFDAEYPEEQRNTSQRLA